MKKHTTILSRLFVAALAVVCFASCSKMDAELPESTQAAITTAPAAAAARWNSPSAWSASSQEGQSLYSVSFTDSSLSAETLKKGLVLVYARPKGSTQVQALPFSEAGQSWYYQASQNTLDIVVESASAPSKSEFAYFIVNQQKIAELSLKGYSKNALISLTYESAQTLLN